MKSETVTKNKTTKSDTKIDTSPSKKTEDVVMDFKAAKPTVSTPTPPKVTPELKKSESGDTEYSYCYTLVTAEQKKVIDLRKYEDELIKLFKSYFTERLISHEISEHTYSFVLTDEFKIGEKRMLGRSVGVIGNMKSHAKKVYYNNGQDFSTQLFKFKKVK